MPLSRFGSERALWLNPDAAGQRRRAVLPDPVLGWVTESAADRRQGAGRKPGETLLWIVAIGFRAGLFAGLTIDTRRRMIRFDCDLA